jgi:hypothetical protein
MEILVAIIALTVVVGFVFFKVRNAPKVTFGGTGGPREVNTDVKEV